MCSATVLSVTGRTKVNQILRGPQAGSGPADATSPCYQRMAQNAMAVGGWDRQPGASPRSFALAYQDPIAGVLIAVRARHDSKLRLGDSDERLGA
jgi:hypothetical protein